MSLSEHDAQFLTDNHAAAMATVGEDGLAKLVRVGVALVDGKVWSSGTEDRVRTRRLRDDPRCTLYVYDQGFAWRALETTVTILDGADAPQRNLRLFRIMQDRPTGPLSWFGDEHDEEQFLQVMADEKRLIYQFEVERSYGLP